MTTLGFTLFYARRNAREIYKVMPTSSQPVLHASIGSGTGHSSGYLTAIEIDNNGEMYAAIVKNPQIDAELNSLTPVIEIWKIVNGNAVLFKTLENEFISDQFVFPIFRIPKGITFDNDNNLYLAGMFIIKITPQGVSSRIVGTPIVRPGLAKSGDNFGTPITFDSGTHLNVGPRNLISDVKFNKPANRLIYTNYNGVLVDTLCDTQYNYYTSYAHSQRPWVGGKIYSMDLSNNTVLTFTKDLDVSAYPYGQYDSPNRISSLGNYTGNDSYTYTGSNGSVDLSDIDKPLMRGNINNIAIDKNGSMFFARCDKLEFETGAEYETSSGWHRRSGTFSYEGNHIGETDHP